jgi:hypothetical protein
MGGSAQIDVDRGPGRLCERLVHEGREPLRLEVTVREHPQSAQAGQTLGAQPLLAVLATATSAGTRAAGRFMGCTPLLTR